MISPKTYQFLKELDQNNNRPWFQANKNRYEEARANFEEFISKLILEIARFDPPIGDLEAKKSVFRIYRDTRFSNDKRPYKTNFGAHLVAYESKVHDRAGYYIHLQPGNTFLAGGAYLPPGPWIKAIRNAIDQKGKEFQKILTHPDFKKYFREIEGEKLKTTPRDYPADHPFIKLLRYKSFIAAHQLKDKDAMQEDFLKNAAKVFKALKPFDDFLNRSLD
ncbi:MAG: DUF2461 domain-containing protein [bacterium]|nr:MAG: DUF2461 domain-containing protein [bacterium]